MIRSRALAIALAGVTLASAGAGTAAAPAEREGLNLNSFVKQGEVAAHVVLRSGRDPRLLVAFPAGNSGVGLWFAPVAEPAEWTLDGAPQPLVTRDGRGRPLRGVSFRATLRGPRVVMRQAVLSSVRVLRDYGALGTAPAEVLVAPAIAGNRVEWARDRLDGAPGYRLALTVDGGRIDGPALVAGADGAIHLRVEALTGETPLTPFAPGTLLTNNAAADPDARRALDFLAFREKYLAGSWRFLTYFGRDTLMSLRLLMPALTPQAVDSGLASVLARLSPQGDVAHEEDVGEFAILDHRREGVRSDAPTYDYKMVDSALMLAPVTRAWLLDDPRGRARAAAFLRTATGGGTAGAALLRNLRFVIAQAQPFARDPQWRNLVALKPGVPVGEWRDSNDGLGGGRYAYDVNAVLLPAALDAAIALDRAGLLAPYADAADRAALAGLPAVAATWHARAAPLFTVSLPADRARTAIAAYAAKEGVPPGPALGALPAGPLRFNAISLDGDGRPIPIQHSDDGFALLFGDPAPPALDAAAATVRAPFPAGLMTDVGMLVANPAFAPAALQARFGRTAYHGTVVWSWQQALMAAGLSRQIARTDLPPATCRVLRATQARLWTAIDAGRIVKTSELWSWTMRGGRYAVAPFGASGADADESNAAQLWSTVYLAVQPPAPAAPGCRTG